MIKISVITVTYNSETFLEQTILSVIQQTYKNVEYIVIDGQSTDNTLSIIDKYKKYISYYMSEKDINMYDAINKGIKASTGEYIAILNSDDIYANPQVIKDVVMHIGNDYNKAGIYGNRIEIDSCGNYIKTKKSFQVNYKTLLLSRNLTFVSHPCLFISRYVIKDIGLYDTTFSYASDLDFVLRVIKKYKLQYVDVNVACFRIHEGSITSSGKINSERIEILKQYGLYKYSKLVRNVGYVFVWGKYFLRNYKNFTIRNLIKHLGRR